jgi:cystathionine gamma-synthase
LARVFHIPQGKEDMPNNTPDHRFSTRAVHGGEERVKAGHSLTTPIIQTSTYVFRDSQEVDDFISGQAQRLDYGRYGNPTQRAAELKLAELEGAEDGLLFASGMGAVTTTLLAMLSQGHHAVILDDCYRKTRQFGEKVLKKYGIDVTFVPPGEYDTIREVIRPNTRVLVSESPTNPHLNVLDLPQLVDIAKPRRIKVIIDSTFATPFNQRPLEYGADLVLHSATKYLGGHNDLMAGAVLGPSGLVSAIKDFRGILGGTIDPHCAYLLIRGIKTFPLRMARQNETAQRMAEFLEGHPRVRRVYYPGLKSHPHHELARAQMSGFGGVVSFDVAGAPEQALRFMDRLRIPYIGPSLGGVESIVSHPATLSYYELSREERLELGILDELIRYSVGVEDADDLIADLKQALDAI